MIPADRILLDVGGTFIKTSDGRSIPVDSNGSREEITASFREVLTDATDPGTVQIRVAMPGPFDYGSGMFLMKHKFAAVYGEYFADLMAVPRDNCRYAHDVNCMLLGDIDLSPELQNTALITLGTGLGFAMAVDGRLLTNALGSPSVPLYNRPFRDGVLEDYVSKRGVCRLYGQSDISVKEIASRAFAGDTRAREAFAAMGDILGREAAPVLEEYGIRTLLFGGQISRSSELFLPEVRKHLPDVSVRTVLDIGNATFRGLEKM